MPYKDWRSINRTDRPSRGASKEELFDYRAARLFRRNQRRAVDRQIVDKHHPVRNGVRLGYANLSVWHPDYGMTPAAHAVEKRARLAGKARFKDKFALRAKRLGLARGFGL